MKQLFLVLILMISTVVAEDFSEALALIESKVACDQLTDDQFEELGDYYMEQMHPGQAHELMDQKMGGEGSKSLKQVHIQMGKSFYCGEGMIGNQMMGGMMGMMGNNMMGNQMGGQMMNTYGMMGSTMGAGSIFVGLLYLIVITFIVSLVFWGTYLLLVKRERAKKGK